MTSNDNTAENTVLILPPLRNDSLWIELTKKQIEEGKLMAVTCPIYSKNTNHNVAEDTKCVCGRLAHQHSYEGTSKNDYTNARVWKDDFAEVVPLTTFGQLANGARVCHVLIGVRK